MNPFSSIQDNCYSQVRDPHLQLTTAPSTDQSPLFFPPNVTHHTNEIPVQPTQQQLLQIQQQQHQNHHHPPQLSYHQPNVTLQSFSPQPRHLLSGSKANPKLLTVEQSKSNFTQRIIQQSNQRVQQRRVELMDNLRQIRSTPRSATTTPSIHSFSSTNSTFDGLNGDFQSNMEYVENEFSSPKSTLTQSIPTKLSKMDMTDQIIDKLMGIIDDTIQCEQEHKQEHPHVSNPHDSPLDHRNTISYQPSVLPLSTASTATPANSMSHNYSIFSSSQSLSPPLPNTSTSFLPSHHMPKKPFLYSPHQSMARPDHISNVLALRQTFHQMQLEEEQFVMQVDLNPNLDVQFTPQEYYALLIDLIDHIDPAQFQDQYITPAQPNDNTLTTMEIKNRLLERSQNISSSSHFSPQYTSHDRPQTQHQPNFIEHQQQQQPPQTATMVDMNNQTNADQTMDLNEQMYQQFFQEEVALQQSYFSELDL